MILSDNLRGASVMTTSMTCFACSDACMKAMGAEMPLFQILTLRGCATTTILGAMIWATGTTWRGLGAKAWGMMVLRALFEIGAAWFFITALLVMPLADLSAIMQALPLTVTLAAALVLGERVGWRRLTAIGVGFVGVLLIVRPGGEGFGWPALYGLASVACVTARDLVSRRLPSGVPSLLIAAVASAAVMLFGGAGAGFVEWAPLDGRLGLLLMGATGFVVLAYVTAVGAMRIGEISFVAPFRYVSLLVSILLGLAFFGTWPDRLTLLGAVIVVGTGLFTLAREGRLRRLA